MLEDFIQELKEAKVKIDEKISEIKDVENEDDLYDSVDIEGRMWSTVDAVKGSGLLREDLLKKPFEGAFPDIFKSSEKRTKEETRIMKKYVYTKGINEII